jgi:pSer/pThr/pTyr-binding forkhead associated (FHA) protein
MPALDFCSIPSIRGRLVVCDTNALVPFPPGKTALIVGRQDAVENIFPDIDLAPYGGDERGISRQHARIFAEGTQILIEDLGSTNATYVNQKRLDQGQPHPLNDGDTLWLGHMEFKFYTK